MNAEEIVSTFNEKHTKSAELRTRLEDDYGKWRLTPYVRGADYKSFTSNKPRTTADKIMNLLIQSPYSMKIPIDQDYEEERKAKANAERFLIGMIWLTNERFKNLGLPDLISQLVWHSVIRGWWALRSYIIKAKDNSTKPRVDVWDRLHTEYEITDEGLLWVTHRRMASASEIKSQYDKEISKKEAQIYDHWDEEKNKVVIEGEIVNGEGKKKDGFEHNRGHVPVLIGVAGATPPIESENYQDTIKDRGESWLAADRLLVEPTNQILSDQLTIIARGAKVPLAGYSEGGKPFLDNSPWKLDKNQASIIWLDAEKKQEIKPLYQPTMPQDTVPMANELGIEWQEGGLPRTMFGDVPYAVSGYLFNLANKTTGSVIGVGKKCVEDGMDWLLKELLDQFSNDKGFEAVTVKGRDAKNKYFGPVDLKPSDIKGNWYPEFRLMPELPQNEMEQVQMARLTKEADLLSPQTINERWLGVQDPDLEEELKLENWAKNLPAIKLRRVAAKIKDRNPELAAEIIALGMEMATQKPRGEAVQPEFQTGVPNTIYPAEEMGRTPREIGYSRFR